MTEFHILSLGAGIQSTTVYLMAHHGELKLDAAIFADTMEESQATYDHLQWLDNLHSIPIYIVSKSRLGDDLSRGIHSSGQRVASIPAFTLSPQGKIGRTRRQCTKEYKVEVIEKTIRREILNLKYRQRIPKGTTVHLYFGISADEARRSKKIIERLSKTKWKVPHFPLLDRWMTRRDCEDWLKGKVPHVVPKSACVFCPFKDNRSWYAMKQNDQPAWVGLSLLTGNSVNQE